MLRGEEGGWGWRKANTTAPSATTATSALMTSPPSLADFANNSGASNIETVTATTSICATGSVKMPAPAAEPNSTKANSPP